MQKIKCLVKDMMCELDAAEHYAKHAMSNRDGDKELSETYARISRQELEHCKMFHAQAVRLIREYDREPPEAMQAVWEYEHERIMEREAHILVMLDMASR